MTLLQVSTSENQDANSTTERRRPVLRPSLKACCLTLPAFIAIALSACTDETIVFRDRELFETPSAAALGFLGYSDQAGKLTVCGNCHVGVQAQWEETAHADAWAGLQDSGHAQDFCEGCHTVEVTRPLLRYHILC